MPEPKLQRLDGPSRNVFITGQSVDPENILANKISTLNVRAAATLAAGAVYQGTGEDVSNYARVGVSITSSNATDGVLTMEVSHDNITWGGPTRNFADTRFAEPHMWNIVEKYFRIKYTNGTTEANDLSIQVQYSNNADVLLGHQLDGPLIDETEAIVTRSISVGQNPEGTYLNFVSTGSDAGNTTTTPLAGSASFTGTWVNVSQYHGIVVGMNGTPASDGTVYMEFSLDGATLAEGLGTSATISDLSQATPRTVAVVATYYRTRYVNGTTAQSTFTLTTFLSTERVDLTATTNQLLYDNEDVRLVRAVSDYNTERNTGLLVDQFARRKFGRNLTVGTSNETVWTHTANWIPAQTAYTIRIAAGGDAADTAAGLGARSVEVLFLDENFDEVTEILTTAGALVSAATTALAIRVISAKVLTTGTYHGTNVGPIVIEQTTGGGVMGAIAAGDGTTEQAIYTVPNGFTLYMTDIFVSCGQANSADIHLHAVKNADVVAAPFSPSTVEWSVEDFSGADMFHQSTYLKYDAKTDLYFIALKKTGGGTAQVSVDFGFFLVRNPA